MVTQSYNVNIDSKNSIRKEKEMKEKTILSNVHEYVREYNETTGIQGLRYLTEKRSMTEKIVWSIILLTSLSGCIWMIYEILEKYENSPIVIGNANRPGFIHQIPFPAITICSGKKILHHKFVDINFKLRSNISLLNDEEKEIVNYAKILSFENKVYDSIFDEDVSSYTSNYQSVLDFLNENSPVPKLFHWSHCFFMGKRFSCKENFTLVLTSDGICYSFNIMDRSEVFRKQVFHYKDFHQVGRNSSAFDGETGYKGKIDTDIYPRRALAPGMRWGLFVFSGENNKASVQNLTDYRIRIHHPAETYDSVPEKTYSLPINKLTLISVTPELTRTSDKIKNYHIEKRKCYLKGERQLKYFQIYTQSNCNLECLTNFTLSECGCVDFYMPRMNGTEFICDLIQKFCIESAEYDLYDKVIKSNEANSDITKYDFPCNCLPLCSELKYKLEVDIEKEPLYYVIPISELSINFKSSSFSILERNELYGTTDLISNFGGLLGLFTGFSFISLAEIIYFLTLRICCNRRLYGQWTGPRD